MLLYSTRHCLTIFLLCFFHVLTGERTNWKNKLKENERERERKEGKEGKEKWRSEKWEKCWIDDDKVSIASSKSTLYPWLREILFLRFSDTSINSEILYDRILLRLTFNSYANLWSNNCWCSWIYCFFISFFSATNRICHRADVICLVVDCIIFGFLNLGWLLSTDCDNITIFIL